MKEEFLWSFPSKIIDVKTVVSPNDIGWMDENENNNLLYTIKLSDLFIKEE